MEQSSFHNKTIGHQFDSFCKKVLREERRDIIRALQHRAENELSFCEMTLKKFDELMAMDKYRVEMYRFLICGFVVEIESDLLAESLSKLPEKSRKILLLAYFLDMSDLEIASALDLSRSTVQYQRTTSLTKLRTYMGGKIDAEK